MRYLIPALLLLLTGCSGFSSPPEKLYRVQAGINYRWTPVSDKVKWGVEHFDEGEVTGEAPFASDCEEYAAAARYQLRKAGITADRWLVIERSGSRHAVTCTVDGWCLDNLSRIPVKKDALGYQWIRVL